MLLHAEKLDLEEIRKESLILDRIFSHGCFINFFMNKCSLINFYNYKRLHQNLGYKTPYEVYTDSCKSRSFVYAKLGINEPLNPP
jgi:hypothetical protein